MPPPTQVAARAGWGPGLHRLLAGDEEGGWCGAGETAPAVSASASGTLTGHPAATLSVAEAGVDEVLATVVPHLDELDGIRFPAEIRSLLVAVLAPDRPAAPWLALGPPQAAILIRCWPGVSQGPEA
ncbi:MAG TPA: hypothetical protein VFO60_12110, partial [Candidatus Dormibacteraeota bacterium]|nr:hypothetical protein [Candidatus Dormibacteraeota bacterium]